MTYSAKEHETAIGTEYEFRGPGLGYHGCSPGVHLHPTRLFEHETILRMLARAYEAGKKARSEEIRYLLGARGHER